MITHQPNKRSSTRLKQPVRYTESDEENAGRYGTAKKDRKTSVTLLANKPVIDLVANIEGAKFNATSDIEINEVSATNSPTDFTQKDIDDKAIIQMSKVLANQDPGSDSDEVIDIRPPSRISDTGKTPSKFASTNIRSQPSKKKHFKINHSDVNTVANNIIVPYYRKLLNLNRHEFSSKFKVTIRSGVLQFRIESLYKGNQADQGPQKPAFDVYFLFY